MYKMKEEFKTGIEFIDEQHKKLFEIADKAYNLLTNNFTLD
ncbi:bacteriohemerythrin, partial [Clostridium botulinum]|nr:bacteriohemerythrin [Clostridium botulinum]